MPRSKTCFFCSSPHATLSPAYDLPLCSSCVQMERFQILLLQQLCFIQSTLYELQAHVVPQPDDTLVGEE